MRTRERGDHVEDARIEPVSRKESRSIRALSSFCDAENSSSTQCSFYQTPNTLPWCVDTFGAKTNINCKRTEPALKSECLARRTLHEQRVYMRRPHMGQTPYDIGHLVYASLI